MPKMNNKREHTMNESRRLPLVGPHRKKALQALDAQGSYSPSAGAIAGRQTRQDDVIQSGKRTFEAGRHPATLDEFPRFVEAVSQRLALAGWGFVLWWRLQRMKQLHDTQYKLQELRTASRAIEPNKSLLSTRARARGAAQTAQSNARARGGADKGRDC
jgi:hypothetical protein